MIRVRPRMVKGSIVYLAMELIQRAAQRQDDHLQTADEHDGNNAANPGASNHKLSEII